MNSFRRFAFCAFGSLIGMVGGMAGANASLDQAPPAFAYRDGQAVFVDFTNARYELDFDSSQAVAHSISTIEWTQAAAGYAIFDLESEPTRIEVDGQLTTQEQIRVPDRATMVRVLGVVTSAGTHRMRIEAPVSDSIAPTEAGVGAGFWFSDLDDRQYLERYLPASFEYDAVPMTFVVRIHDPATRNYQVRANGRVTQTNAREFEVRYPDYYTCSSLFFHLLPEGAVQSLKFTLPSADGRTLPVEIYGTTDLAPFQESVSTVLPELERDYGPWPHAAILVYATPDGGGMEYSGATATALFAVGHEMFHSYHARSLMPAQGNAGWMDEAIASWRDEAYTLRQSPGRITRMAGHSLWERKTDRAAYSKGRDFLAWIAGRMHAENMELKAFLRQYHERFKFTTVTTPQFQAELQNFTHWNLSAEFDRYVYGRTAEGIPLPQAKGVHEQAENPIHRRLTAADRTALSMPSVE